MNDKNQSVNVDQEEIFHLAYVSFINELVALSQSPEIACEMEDHYNVAYEFWYLLPNDTLLENSQQLLTGTEVGALKKLFSDIKALPDEAYTWTDIAEESIKNMQHPAWEPIRMKAKELLLSLAPITKLNNEYFNQPQH